MVSMSGVIMVGATYGGDKGRAGQRKRRQGSETHTLQNDGEEESDDIGGHDRQQKHEG